MGTRGSADTTQDERCRSPRSGELAVDLSASSDQGLMTPTRRRRMQHATRPTDNRWFRSGPCRHAVAAHAGPLADLAVVVKASSGPSRSALPESRAATTPARPPAAGAKAVESLTQSARGREGLLGSAFDLSPYGIGVVGLDGRWLEINDAYCRMLGYERSELVGTSFRDFTHPEDVAEDRDFLAAAIAGELDSSDREKRYVRKNGSALWARVRAEIVRDESGEPRYFVSHLQEITERRAAQELQRLSERTLRSVIDNTPAMISVKDRDHRYTLVNREFEQAFGVTSDWIVGRSDAEIVPASRIAEVHAKDLLVLDGGQAVQDEETIVLDGKERVLLRTRFPLLDEDGAVHAVCQASTDITERRLEERSKRERLQCSEMIYSALAQARFVLHGQPIVNLASMQPVRSELLIRMRKATGSDDLLAPDEFLPAAERFDLIQVIDEWVIDHAIKLAVAGHCVTVNVSAKTISDPAHVDRIEQAVIASGASAENLVFEITETAVADNLDAARTFATRLRQHGCAIALDDFGVGHGTFTYLRHLPVDYLKIEMQFVRNLLNDDEDREIVVAIVGVARQFKIETIAEGVEDQATLEELRRIGVDYVQGYWTGRPAPLPNRWIHPRNRRGDAHATSGQ
jgi:PAS domain S-box-containing protein